MAVPERPVFKIAVIALDQCKYRVEQFGYDQYVVNVSGPEVNHSSYRCLRIIRLSECDSRCFWTLNDHTFHGVFSLLQVSPLDDRYAQSKKKDGPVDLE
jgi:hypothetical protein